MQNTPKYSYKKLLAEWDIYYWNHIMTTYLDKLFENTIMHKIRYFWALSTNPNITCQQ